MKIKKCDQSIANYQCVAYTIIVIEFNIMINKLYCIMCGVEVNTKTRTLINWLYDRLQIDKRSVAKWRFA